MYGFAFEFITGSALTFVQLDLPPESMHNIKELLGTNSAGESLQSTTLVGLITQLADRYNENGRFLIIVL